MSNPHEKIIVFDMDGTLVDSAPDLVAALNLTIANEGASPVSVADIGYLAGQGALPMLEKALNKNIEESRKNELLDIFLNHYETHIADETKFFEGCLEALEELRHKNFIFAICTNKQKRLADKLVEKLECKELFVCVTGGDSYEFKKPDSRHLIETIKLAGGDISRSIMVGDSINDIKAAKDGGIASIAVSFGYSEHPVGTLGADIVIDHFSQFVGAVENIESNWN